MDSSRRKPEVWFNNELDRISELPDPLICQVLYHLPTKDAVRTSVLSTRWRTLWLWVPRLGLNYRDFQRKEALVNFGDRFFDSDRVSCIEKVELDIVDSNKGDYDYNSYVTSWIDAAVKRKIQHLDVRSDPDHRFYHCEWIKSYFHGIPLSLYISETLVSLILHCVFLPDSEFISLPCLKIMHLISLWNPNEATFERLVSSCPVLEELEVDNCLNDNVKVFRVISKSLKKLSIQEGFSKVVIDAPRLGFLSIYFSLLGSYMITNVMDTNLKLVIHFGNCYGDFDETSILSNRNRFCSCLSGISMVRDMTIFVNSSTGCSCLKWVPTILESFPNLKSLSLECDTDTECQRKLLLENINISYVPECLLSSLEFVDFNVPLASDVVGEMNIVRYILENSAILKKLTLRLHQDCSTNDELVEKLLKIPRGSTKCEFVFFDCRA
ncbi:hypothetical protein N665_0014s0070 [Sinapis alba]|nr:hypothetical protein N665_0014s0070 [Sinapis alba]